MKRTLHESEMVNDLMSDEYANWTREGAWALVEWLEELDRESLEETEWDRVAIRCDWSEYASALEAASDYGIEAEDEDTARRMLEDRTCVIVIPKSTRVIVQQH